MRRARWRLSALLLVTALAAFGAACGDDGDDTTTTAAAPATSAAETAAAESSAATSAAAEPTAAESSAPAETAASGDAAAVSATGLGSKYDVASAGDVTLKLWWLGDLEAPGIEGWMDEMITAFQTENPNVKVEATNYETGTWVQTQTTACQSQSGPDLWYNWAGTWTLNHSWAGCALPNEDVLDASDIAANPYTEETRFEGKTWLFPVYRFVYPMVYNKALFTKAGLDPEQAPATWEELVAAAKALQGADVTPIALGLKDGFGGEIFAAGQLEKQWVSQPQDIMQKVVDGNLATPEWRAWIEKAFELKPYFNEDANSLGFADANALFQSGKAAMVAGAPGIQATIKAMQGEGVDVGVFKMPAFDDGAWADTLTNTGNGFQVLSWTKNKQAAGAFLAFLQRPENLDKLYAATGNFPSSSNWTASNVSSPTDQQMLDMLAEKGDGYWAASYTPVDLDVNGTFPMWQKMIAGELDVDGAVKLYQDVLTKWIEANPQSIENYQKWLAG
jgi:raffinose/stachyose/melibiose transport system substrate-binding protein